MWVFGGGRNAQSARSRLDDQLTLQIDRLDRNCGISPEQRTKLMLAGHGDIKKFFDKVAEKKRKFDELKHDQNRIGEIFQEIQPLQLTFNQGIFNDNSIYQKTVKNTLNDEQRDKFRRMNDDLMLFRYRSRVALAVSMLDNSIGFSADQRRKFEKLLVDETKPPKKFSQYDTQVVFLQASHIPEAKVKAIFDDDQFRVLSRQFQQARNMEPFLRSNGFIGEEVHSRQQRALPRSGRCGKQRLVAPRPSSSPSKRGRPGMNLNRMLKQHATAAIVGVLAACACAFLASRPRERPSRRPRALARSFRETSVRCTTAVCTFWRRPSPKMGTGPALGASKDLESPGWP